MKKVFALVMVALMVMSVFAGCGSSSDADPAVIKIGMSGPLTGPAAQYGIAVEAGMQIAVEEINALGGIQFEFKSQDDQADGETALNAYNALKDWGMDILAGCVTTDSCNAVAPETVADKMFMFTPSGSATSIAMAGPNVFQMCFTDPNQGASAAELMKNKWPDAKIGVIYDSSDSYSTGIFEGFMEAAKGFGLNVVCETSFTKDSNTNLTTQVTQCKDAGADLVFLPFYYTEASRVLNAANDMGYDPIFFGCDGMDGILAVEGFDLSLAEGLVLMTPFDANAADEATQSFVAKFKQKMNGQIPNQFAADGYDVIYAIYNALTAAGLDGTASSAEICEALMAQFATMSFDGLTGKDMHWDENGMISKMPAAVMIVDGIYVPVS